MSKSPPSRLFYGYVVAAAVFFSMLAMWGTYYTFGIFLTALAGEFGWSRAVTSGAFSLSTLLRGPFSFITGTLTDRWGPRLVVTVCGLFLGLGYLLMSRVTAIWQLYLFYGVLIGIGMGASFTPLVSTIARWFDRRRGLMTGIAMCGSGLGILIMPALATWLIADYSWRTSYVVWGILAIVIIGATAQLLRPHPGGTREVQATESHKQALTDLSPREALGNRTFQMVCLTFLLGGITVKAVMVHIVPYVADLGLPPEVGAGVLGTVGAVSIAGRLGLGAMADKVGSRAAMVTIFALFGAALLWLYSGQTTWTLYLFAAVFGLAYGGFYVVSGPYVAEFFGLKSHGTVFGIATFWHEVGGALGAVGAGWLFDSLESYTLAFTICALLSLTAVVTTMTLRSQRFPKPGTRGLPSN